MSQVFAELVEARHVLVYMDDLVAYSITRTKHIQHVHGVLQVPAGHLQP